MSEPLSAEERKRIAAILHHPMCPWRWADESTDKLARPSCVCYPLDQICCVAREIRAAKQDARDDECKRIWRLIVDGQLVSLTEMARALGVEATRLALRSHGYELVPRTPEEIAEAGLEPYIEKINALADWLQGYFDALDELRSFVPDREHTDDLIKSREKLARLRALGPRTEDPSDAE